MSTVTIDSDTLNRLTPDQLAFIRWQVDWVKTARPNQIPPDEDWSECGYMAGRGFGKTRVGAEWITRAAYEDPSGFDSAVVCPTHGDVRFTAFEGESGILAVLPPELLIDYTRADAIIARIKNIAGGESVLRGFSAEKPERLRGPQHCRAWCDELAAWQYAEDTWDMLQFGLRLGPSPQVLWTTTPKPKELIRDLTVPKEGRIIIKGTTYDNRDNLPKKFYDQVAKYEGTQIGRQELMGELLDPEEAGIVRRSWFRLWPSSRPLPVFDFIVMSLDTAFTEATYDKKTGDADSTACVVLGVFTIKNEQHILVLDCWDDRIGMPDLIKRVKRESQVAYGDDQDAALIVPMFGSSKPRTSGRKPDMVLIEDKGSGISLRQMLEREQILAYAYNPGKADKLARLHMVSHVFARRRVWLPETNDKTRPGKPRNWCEPLIAQLCSFTGTGSIRHDDYVDATTQGVRICIDQGLIDPTIKPKRPEVEYRDYVAEPLIVENPYAA